MLSSNNLTSFYNFQSVEMAKRQHFSNSDKDFYPNKSKKLITTNFNDLPDEIQLMIFNYLTIKDLIQCGQVSKRTRRISLDSTVWQKVNLHKKYVPPKFIKFILDHGCQYMDLSSSRIVRGDLQLNGKIYNLKYLNLGKDCFSLDILLVPKFSKRHFFRDISNSCKWVAQMGLAPYKKKFF